MSNMRRILTLLLVLAPGLSLAQTANYRSWCETGLKNAALQGIPSSTLVQASLQSCTVTVYLHGTLTLATIYADAANTPLSNPFNTNTDASYLFYASTSNHYDATLSGTVQCVPSFSSCPVSGILNVTYTVSDIVLGGGGGGGGGSAGLPFLSFQGNCSGTFCGVPGALFSSTTGQVNGNPLGASYPTIGATWDVSSFGFVNTMEDFNWVQSPTSPSSITPGSATVTINAVRGVSGFSVAPGIYFSAHVNHYLYLSGTGTPEAVLLTATTCSNLSVGNCTVTFNAVNTHAAGYTLGSATNGAQEAYNDAYQQAVATRANAPNGLPTGHSGIRIIEKAGDYVTFNGQFTIDTNKGTLAPVMIDCQGGTIVSNVLGGRMVQIGGSWSGDTLEPDATTIQNCNIMPSNTLGRTANGNTVAFWDHSQNARFINLTFGLNQTSNNAFDYLIVVDGDQLVVIDTINTSTGNGPPMKCDTTWCGPAVFATGLNSAAHGIIQNSNFTINCNASAAFDWESGNGLVLSHNIIQNWALYPWKYGPGLVDIIDYNSTYYEAPCVNPQLGYAAQTGPQYLGNHAYVANSPSPGIPPSFTQFSNAGINTYVYYVIGVNGSSQQTNPMELGFANSDNATQYTMKWPTFGAVSYLVLRVGPLVNNGTDAAPFGTGNYQVASIASGSCTSGICSFTETYTAPSSVTVNPAYVPPNVSVSYWPAPFFISNSANTACDKYVGVAQPQVNTGLYIIGCNYHAIFTGAGIGGGNCIACNTANTLTGLRTLLMSAEENQSSTGTATTGARIFPASIPNQPLTGFKGIINTATLWSPSSHDTDLFTFYDSSYNKTINTFGHQPLADTGDSAIGITTSPLYLGIRAATELDLYINHKFDSGTSALEKLTASAHTFTVPITTPSATLALSTTAIGANTCAAAQTVTLTGLTTGSVVKWSFASTPIGVTGYGTGGLQIVTFATSNTANFVVCNITAGSITPGSISVNVREEN